jgi:radical SAM superfamily enzyme YgiQ (UPF0313 family)
MKRAGCWKLLVGFESGDPGTLERVDKGASVDDGRQLMEAANAAKMDVHGCFVLGFPGENERSMQRTIDFALSLGLHTVQFTAAVPYPGTKLYDECQREGLLAAESWEDWLTNGEQTGVIELPGLPKQTIEKYVDQGLRRFYFRPSYMLRFFAKTRSVSDFYRKARGFYNYASYIVSDAVSNLRQARPAA